jgi:hypothetical protein
MIAIWPLAIYTAGVASWVYRLQLNQPYPGFVAPRVRVGTFVEAVVSFFMMLYLTHVGAGKSRWVTRSLILPRRR